MNKESIGYSRAQRRLGDKAQRPFNSYKSGDNNSTSLNIKSKSIDLEKITMSKEGLNFSNSFRSNVNDIVFDEYLVLDLSKSNIHNITLTNNLFIPEIKNYSEGITYYLIINQDSTGGHQIAWGDNINIKFDDGVIDDAADSETMIKITPLNGVLYAEVVSNYSNLPTGSLTFTIDTTLGSNAGPSYKLQTKPDYESITKGEQYTFNYDFIVDWGDGTSDHITSAEQPENNHIYSTDGQYIITITGLCEAFGFIANDLMDFENGYVKEPTITSMDFEKIITVGNLGNIGLKDASVMFGSIMGTPMNITSVDATNWDVFNVTDMSGMFVGCSSLTSIDVSNWDVSNVTYIDNMFVNCTSLTTIDVSNWVVSNVTNMYAMFSQCSSLTTIDTTNWDVSNVTDMSYMFENCTSLTSIDVSNWDVSNVTYMSGMFGRCTSLTSIDVSNWDVFNVTYMSGMFGRCTSLTSIDVSNWDVSNVTYIDNMFVNCTSLTTIDVSNWNVSNVTNMLSVFRDVPLDTPSYDGLLIGWSSLSPNLQDNVDFGANLAKYTPGGAAEAGRTLLTDAVVDGGHAWSITDAGPTA